MERREYTRVATEIPAELRLSSGEVYTGIVRDMSFGGAYLDCDVPILLAEEKLPQTRDSVLILKFNQSEKQVYVDMRCCLVGVEECRAGLRWSGADKEPYQLFRDFMMRSASDPEKLWQEICQYPKSGFPRERRGPTFMDWLKRLFRPRQGAGRHI
jgi:hypothetical protein